MHILALPHILVFKPLSHGLLVGVIFPNNKLSGAPHVKVFTRREMKIQPSALFKCERHSLFKKNNGGSC